MCDWPHIYYREASWTVRKACLRVRWLIAPLCAPYRGGQNCIFKNRELIFVIFLLQMVVRQMRLTVSVIRKY
jgi:hypothetical protein